MTTFVDFVPPPRAGFQFQPVVDGYAATASVRWSVFGQRWRFTLTAADGTRVVSLPLVGSADPVATASVTWDSRRALAVVATAVPHGVPLGGVVRVVLDGVAPAGFNGAWLARADAPSRLLFDLATDPGGDLATIQGTVDQPVDLIAGYASVTTIVYRESSRQFEVSP